MQKARVWSLISKLPEKATTMSCTIVPGTNTLSVHSPYNQDFARHARMCGGSWDKDARVWRFSGFSASELQTMCSRYYPEVAIADAIPVPAAPVDHGHVGTVGRVLSVFVEVTKLLVLNGRYGTVNMHVMRDDAGHVFVWYASSARYEVGSRVTLEGKVKKHDTYNGVSQTVLTRCKKIG